MTGGAMAHTEQREFIDSVFMRHPKFFYLSKVLEVGSLDINGSVRDFFTNCPYIGVDVAPGIGVDVVAHGQDLVYPDRHFDVVISAECFEHNPFWRETFVNMVRMCGGLVIFTCATTGRAEHGTRASSPGSSPLTLDWDYYRNVSREDFEFAAGEFTSSDVVDFGSVFDVYEFSTNEVSNDLYFWGIVKEREMT